MRKNKNPIIITIIVIFLLSGCTGYKHLNPNSKPEITSGELLYHINYLASEDVQGRRSGTLGDTLAFTYIAEEFKRIGLTPITDGSYLQEFEFTGGVNPGKNNKMILNINGTETELELNKDYIPYNNSGTGLAEGELIFAGYGISSDTLKYDDYDGIDVEGKIVLLMRYSPDNDKKDFLGYESVIQKIMTARNKNAKAVIMFSAEKENDELVPFRFSQASGTGGIPVVNIRRKFAEEIFEASGNDINKIRSQIDKNLKPFSFSLKNAFAKIETDIKLVIKKTFNVAGYLTGKNPEKKDEVIILGGHYDHLGLGGSGSLGEYGQVHNGADDNASGVAGVLEAAQYLSNKEHNRTILFIAFGAEELGTLGSGHYVKNPVFPLENTIAMINFDMIGRMKDSRLILNGAGTAKNWKDLANKINKDFGFELSFSDGGYGGSDQAVFNSKNIPVLFSFTGTHSDYHKPSDDVEKINSADHERIVKFLAETLLEIDKLETRQEYVKIENEQRRSMPRLRVTMGVTPAFGGGEGFSISDVRAGGPAATAGLKGGDTILKMGDKEIKSIYEYMTVLQSIRPGEKHIVEVKREGKILKFEVQF